MFVPPQGGELPNAIAMGITTVRLAGLGAWGADARGFGQSCSADYDATPARGSVGGTEPRAGVALSSASSATPAGPRDRRRWRQDRARACPNPRRGPVRPPRPRQAAPSARAGRAPRIRRQAPMLPRLPFAGSHNLVCPPPRRRARPRQLPSLIRHRNSAGAARPSVARAPPRVCDGTMSCHLELRPGLLPLPLSPCLCRCLSSLCQATLSQPVVIFWKICAVCCSPLRSECYLWLVLRGRAHHDNNADAATQWWPENRIKRPCFQFLFRLSFSHASNRPVLRPRTP